MRMRKKKNCDARMERCSDIWIKEPEKYKGKWAERFGNDNPIHIEIGCGKGNFIVGMAKMYPDVNFIAIEKVEDVIVMAMEKTVAAELTNVLFMDMDAEKIEDIFEFGEIRRIYLNFSDPWKKNKQAKRRLTHKRFLDRYKAVLKPVSYTHLAVVNMASIHTHAHFIIKFNAVKDFFQFFKTATYFSTFTRHCFK